MRRTRIKICGISSPSASNAATAAGADALGLVFYAPSSRSVDLPTAIELAAEVPALVSVVALFVDADETLVRDVIKYVRPQYIQFHGDEDEDQCLSYGHPYLKAVKVGPETDVLLEIAKFPSAAAILLDTLSAGVAGGTGKCFDWGLVPQHVGSRIILAGGLNADNVGQAMAQVKPFAVDVSGGVESSPGVKDAVKIGEFVAAVGLADTSG